MHSPHHSIKLIAVFTLLGCILLNCSTKKDKPLNIFWHRLNTHYNGYFNAKQAMIEGLDQLEKTKKDNYTRIIPPMPYGGKDDWSTFNASADRVITKSATMIKKHSMLINGNQHNKWIDDCYYLMGKANYFKTDHRVGIAQLRYVENMSNKPETKEIAKIWMLFHYNEMGEYPEGGTVLFSINKNLVDKRDRKFYYAAVADYYIGTNQHNLAIETLKQGIKTIKDKHYKARFYFIIGQLNQKDGYTEDAFRAYKNASKIKGKYAINFQSRIKMAQTSPSSSTDELVNTLEKMLRDDKNIEYHDQIYYALGLVALKAEQRKKAIKYFRKALAANVGNKTTKTTIYLTLAELYFKERNYNKAQLYYDSTAAFIPKDHAKYTEVLLLKNNLRPIVINSNIVATQDSLLALSTKSEDELYTIFEAYIEDLKEREKEAAESGQTNNTPSNLLAGNGSGQWYFTNPQALSFGRSEFKRIWGNRALEDNWRRINKSSTNFNNNNNDQVEQTPPKYTVEFYLNQIPKTDSAKAIARAKILDALYILGTTYKDALADMERAEDAFKSLIARSNQNTHIPITYYQLYLVENALNNSGEQEKYKNIILNKYPDSEYAKILKDPNYLKKKEAEKKVLEPIYASAYGQYKTGFYMLSLQKCDTILIQYPNKNLSHRFALLRALNIYALDTVVQDSLGGRPVAFIAALNKVIKDYPNTESSKTAKQLLIKLGVDAQASNKNAKISEATGAKALTPDKSPYTYQANTSHFYIILVPDAGKNLTEAKKTMFKFNDTQFSLSNLSTSTTLLGNAFQIILIRKFTDAKNVMDYHRSFMAQNVLSTLKLGNGVKTFAISLPNFSTLFKEQKPNVYLKFFEKNYL